MAEVRIFPTVGAMLDAGATVFAEVALRAFAERGRFAVALSGGNTPRGLYERLALPDGPGARIPWRATHVLWGDERCVPPDHPDSNYRLATDALLAHVAIPESQIHRMHGETADTAAAAAEYEQRMRGVLRSGDDGWPEFDLALLGMGADGHTASLFPGSEVIRDVGGRWVASTRVQKLNASRLTLTPSVLTHARNLLLLVAGRDKAEALSRALRGGDDLDATPAQLVRGARGRVVWLIDAEAAADIRAT